MTRRVVEGAEEGQEIAEKAALGRAGIDEVSRGAAKAFDGVLEELLLELLTTLLRQ
jgi:hypothetical protein